MTSTKFIIYLHLSGLVFACMMTVVEQVWGDNRSCSVCSLRTQTLIHLSAKVGKAHTNYLVCWSLMLIDITQRNLVMLSFILQ